LLETAVKHCKLAVNFNYWGRKKGRKTASRMKLDAQKKQMRPGFSGSRDDFAGLAPPPRDESQVWSWNLL
jgi:hypothetical protein